MASPKDRNLEEKNYDLLKVDCLLIQNYDTNDFTGMIDYAIDWAKNLKNYGKM